MTRLSLLLLFVLSACSNSSGNLDEGEMDPRCVRPADEQLVPAAVEAVFVTSQRAELGFKRMTPEGCPGQVRAQVEAPGGSPLEPTLELGQPTPAPAWHIPGVVRFSPTVAGTYRVTLRVEGVEGEVVRELVAAADRSDAAVQELPRWCLALHGTRRGTLLCDGDVYRGTEKVQGLSSESLLATAGDVVWEIDGERVRRYEDTGAGGLTLNPKLALDTHRTQPLALHATEQELLVVYNGGHIVRYVHTEGLGLALSGEAAYPYFTYMDARFQLRRSDDLVLLVASYGTMSAACYYQAAGTELTPRAWAGPSGQQWNKCQALAGIAIGMGEDGLWTRNAPGPEQLRLYQLRGSTFEVSTLWELPSPLSASAGWLLGITTDAQVLQSAQRWFLPRLGEHGVVLDRYEPTDGFEFRAAHGGLAYEISRSTPSRTRVFTR